jgi:hypothetical protein
MAVNTVVQGNILANSFCVGPDALQEGRWGLVAHDVGEASAEGLEVGVLQQAGILCADAVHAVHKHLTRGIGCAESSAGASHRAEAGRALAAGAAKPPAICLILDPPVNRVSVPKVLAEAVFEEAVDNLVGRRDVAAILHVSLEARADEGNNELFWHGLAAGHLLGARHVT